MLLRMFGQCVVTGLLTMLGIYWGHYLGLALLPRLIVSATVYSTVYRAHPFVPSAHYSLVLLMSSALPSPP